MLESSLNWTIRDTIERTVANQFELLEFEKLEAIYKAMMATHGAGRNLNAPQRCPLCSRILTPRHHVVNTRLSSAAKILTGDDMVVSAAVIVADAATATATATVVATTMVTSTATAAAAATVVTTTT